VILPLPDWATYIVAVLVAIVGVGRLSRVIVYDAFPPVAKLRLMWVNATVNRDGEDGPWTPLLTCFWCFTPWLMLFAMGWFAVGLAVPFLAWAWWIFWGWLALSYLSSMLIARDEPADH